ncbi:hypothetical protein SDC9_178506 [bioreactor metagenome]|uniref:Uncharacterized protein n=1 Tax=bioreactor metagenome TaxID=1076179 RepID=A0A645GW59_9ZZZZ
MGRGEGQGRVQVGPGLVQGLTGQAVHQVQVEAFEVAGGQLDGGPGLVIVVDAPQRLEVARVEALDAQGQSRHPGGGEGGELAGLGGARIGLQGDLGPRSQGQSRPHRAEQALQGGTGEQAGGAAADEDGTHRPPPHQGQGRFQVGDQGIHIGVFGNRADAAPGLVGVEVAVGALAHAPGHVDVQRQGRRGDQAGGGRAGS